MSPSEPVPVALRVGTRPGAVSWARAAAVVRAISELDPGVVLEQIRVDLADGIDSAALHEHDPRTAVRLREALLAHEIDIAVHALKDLPHATPRGVRLAAVPLRDDPRDCLISVEQQRLRDLAPGARVGVDGDAREAAVLRLRPDVEVIRVVGPLGERAARVEGGELAGLVVALVAARRTGLHSAVGEIFSVTDVLPAAGQGATAVEILEQEAELGRLLHRVEHLASRWCVTAEREFEQTLEEGGARCVGAYAEVRDMNIHLRGRVMWRGALCQGAHVAPVEALGGLGRRLAEQLLRGEGVSA